MKKESRKKQNNESPKDDAVEALQAEVAQLYHWNTPDQSEDIH